MTCYKLTLFSFTCLNVIQALLRQLRIYGGNRSKLTILDDLSGIIRPSRYLLNFIHNPVGKYMCVFDKVQVLFCRLTLLLGPPSSGKTTLLLALAGRLGHHLQVLRLSFS